MAVVAAVAAAAERRTVICVLILFASQMSSSEQQVPYLPWPAFGSVGDGFQSSWFALPAIHLMSCGHCASQ